MTVKQLIEKLQEFSKKHGENATVSITDGFEALVYIGDFQVEPYNNDKKEEIECDIGIGGMRVE